MMKTNEFSTNIHGSSTENNLSSVVFTPAAVLDLLTQIEELQDQQISLTETIDGKIQLSIGSSYYIIESNTADIEVSEDVVDAIDEENQSAYQDIIESGQAEDDSTTESIEGGMIKDTAKALLLGGLIRFAGKHLLK